MSPALLHGAHRARPPTLLRETDGYLFGSDAGSAGDAVSAGNANVVLSIQYYSVCTGLERKMSSFFILKPAQV